MFCSILKLDEKYYNYLFLRDYYEFENLCKYLAKRNKEGKIDIVKTIDGICQNKE
jgi:hypothetical protein